MEKENYRKIIICRGIQGSGKSTWAKQWVNEDPESRIRINQDDVRNMLGKYWVPSREKLVSQLNDSILNDAMIYKYNIVIDNMNLNPKTLEHIKQLVYFHNRDIEGGIMMAGALYEVEYKDFFIPLEECIRRDANRENPIGEKVIRDTYEKYKNILES